MDEGDTPTDQVGLGKRCRRPLAVAHHRDEAVDFVADLEHQGRCWIVRIDGRQIRQRDAGRPAALNGDLEIAFQPGRHIADFGDQIGARVHGQFAILDGAADATRFGDLQEAVDDNIALDRAADAGRRALDLADDTAAGVDHHLVGDDVALDVAHHFQSSAFPDRAFDGRVRRDDHHARLRAHRCPLLP